MTRMVLKVVNLLLALAFTFGVVEFQSVLSQEPEQLETSTNESGLEGEQKGGIRHRDVFWIAQVKPATLGNWQQMPPRRLEGEIIGFTGKELVVLSESGEPVRHDQTRVIQVEPSWRTDDARKLHELYLQGDYKEFAKKAPPIIQSKIPPWQQRLLLSELIDSASNLGNIVSAGKLFLSLVENNSPDMLYSVMPLCWVEIDQVPTVEKSASDWFEDPRESAQLLASSWLLSGSKRTEARKRLLALSQESKSAPIRLLAAAQLWRVEPIAAAKSSERQVALWQDFRDRMPFPLQIGPTELIADRWVSLQRWDLAVGEGLRVITLYPSRVGRVRRTRELVLDWLNRGGHVEDAKSFQRKTTNE